ncbi:hypothetical protein Misp01_07090 [Microtetraspora sp. NBRC 13810]|uniref:hypothetical protein n=1 Tax=Microtetraspora sp. NBRC 13810 TaxID=3030990 RepID=UPI0024A122E6|nr:hypothetical protein [Microtetraspora sp. NBRC 13810]GLW05579.1 hypothetical protein Misp01_07090 [Microtetraspora sp. NBRC 13810]
MLKKLALGGAVLTAWAGLGLATPAQADAPWPKPGGDNVAAQANNVVVCGNKAIGDISIPLIPLQPVTFNNTQPVDCSIRAYQNQD